MTGDMKKESEQKGHLATDQEEDSYIDWQTTNRIDQLSDELLPCTESHIFCHNKGQA